MACLLDPHESDNFSIFEKSVNLPQRIFTIIHNSILVPIVFIIKWLLIIIVSFTFVPIFYIICNILRPYRYETIKEWVELFKDTLDDCEDCIV